MMQDIFKAYDVRGKYPSEISESVVREVVAVVVCDLSKNNKKKNIFVIAHDARLSSPALYESAIKGAQSIKGAIIITVGLATTPMFNFLVNYFKAIGGVMVTASHNPPECNGLKFVKEKAIPLSGTDIYELL